MAARWGEQAWEQGSPRYRAVAGSMTKSVVLLQTPPKSPRRPPRTKAIHPKASSLLSRPNRNNQAMARFQVVPHAVSLADALGRHVETPPKLVHGFARLNHMDGGERQVFEEPDARTKVRHPSIQGHAGFWWQLVVHPCQGLDAGECGQIIPPRSGYGTVAGTASVAHRTSSPQRQPSCGFRQATRFGFSGPCF